MVTCVARPEALRRAYWPPREDACRSQRLRACHALDALPPRPYLQIAICPLSYDPPAFLRRTPVSTSGASSADLAPRAKSTTARTGHPISSLYAVESAMALYFGGILRYDPKNPHWDRV